MENKLDKEMSFLEQENSNWMDFENDVDNLFKELKEKYSGGYLEAAITGLNTRLQQNKKEQSC